MKKLIAFVLVSICLFSLVACQGDDTVSELYFTGKVVEVYRESCLLEVTDKGTSLFSLGDKIDVHTDLEDCPQYTMGDYLKISFDGLVAESYPPQIHGVTAVSKLERAENAASEKMPPNTTLEFWITENVKDYDWSGHDEIYGWFGAREFLGSGYKTGETLDDQYPKHYVSYRVTAWPDYADGGSFVTNITITDPAVTVYGLTVESSFEEFDAVFEPLGYTLSWSEGTLKTRIANKNSITFRFTRAMENTPEVIPELRIVAHISNRDGIVY